MARLALSLQFSFYFTGDSNLNTVAARTVPIERRFVCCSSAALLLPGCCRDSACAPDKASADDGLPNYCYLYHQRHCCCAVVREDTVRAGSVTNSLRQVRRAGKARYFNCSLCMPPKTASWSKEKTFRTNTPENHTLRS